MDEARGDTDRLRLSDGDDWSPGPTAGAPGDGRVLDLDDEPADPGSPPECAIDGCTRQGVAPRKLRAPGSDERPTEQYVCRYHYRIFMSVRVLVGLVVLAVLIAAYLRV